MSDSQIPQAMAAGYVPSQFSVDYLQESRDVPVIIGISIVTFLTLVVVTSRLLSRKLITKRFGLGLDDGFAILSLAVFIPFVGLCLELVRTGAGRHDAFRDFVIDYAAFARFMITDSVAHLTYSTALVLCRISGLAFYYRICRLHKEFLLAIKVVFCFLVVGYLAQMFLIIFHCKPVNLVWEAVSAADVGKFQCIDWVDIYVTSSAISITCDLLVFGIPIAMIWILDMSRKRKIQLACILLPGFAVVAISVTRLLLVYGTLAGGIDDFGFVYFLTIEVSEIGATLIALSIPGVKPLVDKFILGKKDASTRGVFAFDQRPGSVGSSGSIKPASIYSGFDFDDDDYDVKTQIVTSEKRSVQDGIQVTVDVEVEVENGRGQKFGNQYPH